MTRSHTARFSMTSLAALAAVSMVAASAAHAAKFDALGSLSQDEFRAVSKDLSAAFADKPQAPAGGLGVVGFDVSATVGATKVDSTDALKKAAGGDSVPKALPTVGVRIEKGLPFDIDVGASYVAVPATSASALSGNIKWAFFGGGLVMPAVATRVFYTRTNGLGDMSLNAKGIELSISKGFPMLTPYAGIGVVSSDASAKNTALKSESFTQTRTFVGLNANLLLINFGLEADKTGKTSSVNLKLGVRF